MRVSDCCAEGFLPGLRAEVNDLPPGRGLNALRRGRGAGGARSALPVAFGGEGSEGSIGRRAGWPRSKTGGDRGTGAVTAETGSGGRLPGAAGCPRRGGQTKTSRTRAVMVMAVPRMSQRFMAVVDLNVTWRDPFRRFGPNWRRGVSAGALAAGSGRTGRWSYPRYLQKACAPLSFFGATAPAGAAKSRRCRRR